MLLRPTAKAHRELRPGVQTLTLRQRSVLLLAGGRPAPQLGRLFNGMGEQIMSELLEQGYLAPHCESEEPVMDGIWKAEMNGLEPTHEDV